MIERSISNKLLKIFKQYPVLTITGPRQSGKTTLAKALFGNLAYFNLEDPTHRQFALEDPKGFIRQAAKTGAVIDEIQRAPNLPSLIQVCVDESPKLNSRFVLTGSQQFEVIEAINQSLAGRTALAKLLPLSLKEVDRDYPIENTEIEDILYRGFYPRIFEEKLNPTEAHGFYTGTYIERDVRSIRNVQDLGQFQRYLRICAGQIGQTTNFSSIGNSVGIEHNTAMSWFSILEASYICFRLPPHFKNFKKRLVKSPKIFFHDVGLACYLLGIESAQQLRHHPLKGALFENFIVTEFLKHRYNSLKDTNLYFFRDNTGNEVDLITDHGNEVWPIEIKSGETITSDYFKGLKFYQKINPSSWKKPVVIYGGRESQERSDFSAKPFRNFLVDEEF